MKVSAKSLLKIDTDRTVDAVSPYLQDLLERYSASGMLIGLSGGIDSAVLAALAVRSLGRETVHAYYLYERTSSRDLYRRTQQVSESLGIDLQSCDIDAAMQEEGIYDPFLMRITRFSAILNRGLHRFFSSQVGESPFISSLREGQTAFFQGENQNRLYEQTIRYPEAAFNARHIHRREVLEKEAETHGWVLLGAANRTEWLVGWFVKDGIDDLPLQPLKGLYKTQIRQLAGVLGIPEAIRSQAPSPDMMKGITDEFALGLEYEKIDLVLDHLEGGVSMDELLEVGVTKSELEKVREMKQLSEWKREGIFPRPPVDGGPEGGVRIP